MWLTVGPKITKCRRSQREISSCTPLRSVRTSHVNVPQGLRVLEAISSLARTQGCKSERFYRQTRRSRMKLLSSCKIIQQYSVMQGHCYSNGKTDQGRVRSDTYDAHYIQAAAAAAGIDTLLSPAPAGRPSCDSGERLRGWGRRNCDFPHHLSGSPIYKYNFVTTPQSQPSVSLSLPPEMFCLDSFGFVVIPGYLTGTTAAALPVLQLKKSRKWQKYEAEVASSV